MGIEVVLIYAVSMSCVVHGVLSPHGLFRKLRRFLRACLRQGSCTLHDDKDRRPSFKAAACLCRGLVTELGKVKQSENISFTRSPWLAMMLAHLLEVCLAVAAPSNLSRPGS